MKPKRVDEPGILTRIITSQGIVLTKGILRGYIKMIIFEDTLKALLVYHEYIT